MNQTRSLLTDGAWLTGLQVTATLGQLAGIRLLTEVLPPTVFGEFSLWLGIVTFVASGLANPTMQGLLRYYPEYAKRSEGGQVKTAARKQLVKLMVWFLPVFVVGLIAAFKLGWADMTIVILLVALVVVEIARMQGSALLNVVRAHRAYGLWAVAEAWGRPVMAWALVSLAGLSVTLVLAGYLLASVCTWTVMRRLVPRDRETSIQDIEQSRLADRLWRYTLPLLPLGVLGWLSGMADRYMIGALLSPAEVGLYVAIYGLASRPMLMFGGVVENTIRPVYQSAILEGEFNHATSYLFRWTLAIALGSAIAITLAWACHTWLARLLLGDGYRNVSYLMPWIVGGYALCLQSQVMSRVCYAHGATQKVLQIEGLGAILAISIGYLCISQAGVWGAALAVPIYFGVQLVAGLMLSHKWLSPRNVKLT
jgi:O-antigen/teichoic acid export membrane protein